MEDECTESTSGMLGLCRDIWDNGKGTFKNRESNFGSPFINDIVRITILRVRWNGNMQHEGGSRIGSPYNKDYNKWST